VILWASELAQRDLDPESGAHVHLAYIRQRVHESTARLRDIQENGVVGPAAVFAQEITVSPTRDRWAKLAIARQRFAGRDVGRLNKWSLELNR